MNILQIAGVSRDNGAKKLEKLLASLDRERAREVSDKVQEGGRSIGERHETITSALEEAASALTCIRGVEAALDRARKNLGQEFETRRADRAEIVALNALLEQTGQELAAAWKQESDLQARLNTTESALAEIRSQRLELETLANARLADIGRLTGELASCRTDIGELRNSLDQAGVRVQRLEEDNARLRGKIEETEGRRQEAEAQAAAAVQARGLLDVERGVLEHKVESLTADVSRAARTVADLEAQVAAEKARGRGLEATAQTAQAELERLHRTAEEQAERARAQVETAELRLATAQARAVRLEEESAALGQSLAEASARERVIERDAGELKLRVERSDEQAGRLAADLTLARKELADVESARAAAVERADRMTELSESRLADAKRLDEQVDVLQSRIETLEAELVKERLAADERTKALIVSVERERSERSIVAGALEAARKGRARLHLEMLKVSGGRPVAGDFGEDAPETAKAANADN